MPDVRFILKLILLGWISHSGLITGVEVTYEELRDLNATCYPSDTCQEPRLSDSPGISPNSSCSCNRLCSHFSTCCVDSLYGSVKPPSVRPTCRTVKSSDKAYFMVDRCSDGDNSVWEALCSDESNKEKDVMKMVPVTSMFTSITYKNCFCLWCHEKTNNFFFWNIFVKSSSKFDVQPETDDVKLSYSNDNESYVLTHERSNASIAVNLNFDVPPQLWSLPIECEANVISDCNSSWTEDSTRDKCHAYTAVVYVRRDGQTVKYRNTHCALCNFESLDSMICKSRSDDETTGESTPAPGIKMQFSFTHLMDINRSDGDKVGIAQKCEGNFLWDPFSKKCRVLSCALPGHVVIGKKCVRQ